MDPRTVPTPATPRPGPATPAAAAAVPAYDRRRWEEALIASSMRSRNALLLGWALSHTADPNGFVPSSLADRAGLGRRSHLASREVRFALEALETCALIRRPDADTWPDQRKPRPITLTLPAAQARARKEQPPSPSTGGGGDA